METFKVAIYAYSGSNDFLIYTEMPKIPMVGEMISLSLAGQRVKFKISDVIYLFDHENKWQQIEIVCFDEMAQYKELK